MNENEDLSNPNVDCNDSSECVNSKQGRKRLIGSPAEETFFTLAHYLRAFSGLIVHMLVKKKFKFVLTGRINNDPIEHRFSLIRFLAGNHLALDVSTFAHNERTLLFKLVTQLCTNVDSSHDTNMYKSFFNDIH